MYRNLRLVALVLACWTVTGLHADPPPSFRVISLAPSLTELVYDLGLEEFLVGRTNACDFPDTVQQVPVVGGFGRPNWEALLATRPDAVLATALEKPGLMQRLKERGIQALLLPCDSWAELKDAARQISAAVDRPEVGQQWVSAFEQRRDGLAAEVERHWQDRPRPRIYVEVWGQPILTAGGGSFLHDVVTLAGGDHLGAGLRGDYPSISSEWVIQQDPDCILLAYMLPEMRPAEALRKRIGWNTIRAVREDRIIDDINPDWLLRPGPRLVKGAEALAQRLMALSNDEQP